MNPNLLFNITVGCLLYVATLASKELVQIPEASGICFVPVTNSLFVVNDEGTLYNIKKDGTIITQKYLGKYDLEGITYDIKNDKLLLAVEGDESILIVNRKSLKIEKEIKIKRKFEKVNLLKKSKGSGIEAIAIDENGAIYLSNQSKITYKKKLKENASVIFRIDSFEKKKVKITEVFNHGYMDIAGLTFHEGYLYMTSDKENLLIKYDLKNNKTIKKIKLQKSAQEGIAFDDENNIYIADDTGRVLKYKQSELGI
ncbi:MAG: SdiA-regulated domain-containing protein [Arcobacteraceae bacterium]